jgi:hypothetical protein
MADRTRATTDYALVVSGRVTKRHIACGKAEECLICPIALMLIPLVEPLQPLVFGDCIQLHTREGIQFQAKVPCRVREWIHRFDMGMTVEPVDLTLRFRRVLG